MAMSYFANNTSAAVAVLLAVVLSVHLIKQHLRSFIQPTFQLHICRILLIVPIFAVQSYFSFIFPSTAVHLEAARDCYEAFVLYTFFTLLLNFVGGEEIIIFKFSHKTGRYMSHPYPFSKVFRPIRLGRRFLRLTKRGVLQFVFVKPFTALLSLAIGLFNATQQDVTGNVPYETQTFLGRLKNVTTRNFWESINKGSILIFIMNNLSVGTAMYCLVLFYISNRSALSRFNPFLKFMCVKVIVFLSFWQSHVLTALLYLGVLPQSLCSSTTATESVGCSTVGIRYAVLQLNDWLLCFEMLGIAVVHIAAFPPSEFVYLPLECHQPGSGASLSSQSLPRGLQKYQQHSQTATTSIGSSRGSSRPDAKQNPIRDNFNKVLRISDFIRDVKSTIFKTSNSAQPVPVEVPLQQIAVHSVHVEKATDGLKEKQKLSTTAFDEVDADDETETMLLPMTMTTNS